MSPYLVWYCLILPWYARLVIMRPMRNISWLMLHIGSGFVMKLITPSMMAIVIIVSPVLIFVLYFIFFCSSLFFLFLFFFLYLFFSSTVVLFSTVVYFFYTCLFFYTCSFPGVGCVFVAFWVWLFPVFHVWGWDFFVCFLVFPVCSCWAGLWEWLFMFGCVFSCGACKYGAVHVLI